MPVTLIRIFFLYYIYLKQLRNSMTNASTG